MNIWKRNTDNDAVKQYLLGNLSESAREKLERRVLNETEVNEEVQASEDELIDQYLGGKLNAEERKQFETYFLLPQERQRKLRFGRTLRRYLDLLPGAKANQDLNKSSLVWLKRLEPRFALAGSLVLVSLAVLATLWLVNNRRVDNGQTLAITLQPGSSRANEGSIQRLQVPASYRSVEVQLEMASNEYPVYEVELLREHQSLNTYKSLHAQNKDGHLDLVLVIPAELLEVGDYTFKVSGASNAGQIEYKDQYQLRVIPAR